MRLFILAVLPFLLAACSSSAPHHESFTQRSEIVLPQSYAFMGDGQPVSEPVQQVAQVTENPVAAGQVSRFERKIIVPGGPDGEMTPCAKNFDGIMDHLEALMADKIAENNAIAARQMSTPGYRF